MPIELTVFADYFQVYLEDDEASGAELLDDWTRAATELGMASAPKVVAFGTVRNMKVPVSLEVVPSLPDDLAGGWDRVTEATASFPSGKVVVMGPTDYRKEAPRFELDPGRYLVRVYGSGFGTISRDGLDGEDRYRVLFTPATEDVPPRRVWPR